MNRLGMYYGPDAPELQVDTPNGATSAAQWIRDRWNEFLGLYPSLLDLQHRAAVVAARALQEGDQETHDLAKAAVQRLADVVRVHQAAVAKFEELGAMVPGLTQGLSGIVVPLAAAAAVVALAATVAYVFSRESAEQRIVQMLEAGQLTTDEADRILSQVGPAPGASIGTAVKWIGGAFAGWVAFQWAREVFGWR